MTLRLRLAGLPFEAQKSIEIIYMGEAVGTHRIDLLVDGRVVVEIKAIRSLENIHFATVRSYLKALDLESGLILNFATMPLTIKRVGREYLLDEKLDTDCQDCQH